MNDQYIGSELELFATARTWKTYVARRLQPFIGRRVLEIGAGIGSNIPFLWNRSVSEWTAVEPDASQAQQIHTVMVEHHMTMPSRIVTGTLSAIEPTEQFETILYIDVLEHIEDDASELARAASHLAFGGNLVVLVPAHQFLFSAFDAAIGHYRRYDLPCWRG